MKKVWQEWSTRSEQTFTQPIRLSNEDADRAVIAISRALSGIEVNVRKNQGGSATQPSHAVLEPVPATRDTFDQIEKVLRQAGIDFSR